MKPQIYNFETKFNFGKHIGKSLREVSCCCWCCHDLKY